MVFICFVTWCLGGRSFSLKLFKKKNPLALGIDFNHGLLRRAKQNPVSEKASGLNWDI
jgi:hypothetical protein